MAELPFFKQKQYEFAAHIRNPETNPRPADVEARRMNIYTELFYNNIEGFISDGFPVLRSIFTDENWHKMVRNFMEHHHCKTPYFLEISEEFLDYLQNEHKQQEHDPDWMLELAHYEWVELALSVQEEEPDYSVIDENGDLLDKHPLISPLAWCLNYNYPVHMIGPEHLPEQPEATHLVVYRKADDEITFLSINPVTARLLDLLDSDENITGQQALEQIAAELQHPQPETVVQGGAEIMKDLLHRGILLGIAK